MNIHCPLTVSHPMIIFPTINTGPVDLKIQNKCLKTTITLPFKKVHTVLTRIFTNLTTRQNFRRLSFHSRRGINITLNHRIRSVASDILNFGNCESGFCAYCCCGTSPAVPSVRVPILFPEHFRYKFPEFSQRIFPYGTFSKSFKSSRFWRF